MDFSRLFLSALFVSRWSFRRGQPQIDFTLSTPHIHLSFYAGFQARYLGQQLGHVAHGLSGHLENDVTWPDTC